MFLLMTIGGSDIAVRDVEYELRCRYKDFDPDDDYPWSNVISERVSVKVLPDRLVEPYVSESVGLPVFSRDEDGVYVTVSSSSDSSVGSVSEVRVHNLDKDNQNKKQISTDSLSKIFVARRSCFSGW